MIIARIWGGLGNQMFQYAIAYAMARNNNTDFMIDTSFFYENRKGNRVTSRDFELKKFPNYLNTQEITRKGLKLKILQNPFVNYTLRKMGGEYIKIGDYILEAEYKYHPNLYSTEGKNLYLDGYWHCEKYFLQFKNEIKSLFTFSDKMIEEEFDKALNKGGTPVSIHVRRGDYISQNNPNVRGEDYYRSAIRYFDNCLEKPLFCFFSDDIDWVIKTFKDLDNYIIVNEDRKLSDIQELQLMSRCKHSVISNSSYSWWGAWLNDNDEKIVVAPKEWKNKKDMMPSEWVRL